MATNPKKNSTRSSKDSSKAHGSAGSRGQKGGTLLGLVIGLVIGLGIALAVALSISKAGLPFIAKGAQPRAAEGSGGAIVVDPNKPLYGNKDTAREAARKQTEPELPSPTVAKSAAEPGQAPPVEKSAAVKPDAGEEKYTYYLQAGAFRAQDDADNIKAKLALLGFEARVTERLSDNGTLYRVRVGPFGQIETMNRIREKLSDNGIDVAVVRSPK